MRLRNGVDMVKISRIEEAFARRGEAFLARFCTAAELDDCRSEGDAGWRWGSLAARFAAKEALAKALGTGIAGGVNLREIEVARGESGEPHYKLSGSTEQRFADAGFTDSSLSLSHEADLAIAMCVIW
ncbi:MAG: holo-[acyl-carrier-protein] synthase [Clostridia bacterium]|nr:holo-[acyl-carrier-protein] synthase [Clostridia bacterium]NLF20692.1 holo-ACP synthase [Clostridiaceae bacterium]